MIKEYDLTSPLAGYVHTREELMAKGVITSCDGFHYSLSDFTEDMVDEDFIIQTLAKMFRYNGQAGGDEGYSVAQHSYMMAESVLLVTGNPHLAWDCLWHDAGEAYTGDMVRPLKSMIEPIFGDIERNIEEIIFAKLGVMFPFHPMVKVVDVNICHYELTCLMNPMYNNEPFKVWNIVESKNNFRSMVKRLKRLKELNPATNEQ